MVKLTWNVTLWERESSKSIQFEKMQVIIGFHASKTIHGWYFFSNLSIILNSIVFIKIL
jgi:hypothetical protein